MINIENVEIYGWEAAIRGMRNPKNSWDKSDSTWKFVEGPAIINPNDEVNFVIGENDLKLMKTLAGAGNDHGKFMRMITVTLDITAPLYWVAEHDTYKIATVRNSCSFMHRGVSKPFKITDFSVSDERIYTILSPLEKKTYEIKYPYETDLFKIYITPNNRKYKVFENGRVYRCEFDRVDNWGNGRIRHFQESEVKPSKTNNGYYEVNVGGRCGERKLLHRLVAECWIPKPDNCDTVHHIDGNKGNNSVHNLEWVTREDNIKNGFEDGLYSNISSLHCKYLKWKNGSDSIPRNDWGNENYELFYLALVWERTIDTLNSMRDEYLETKDESVFQMIRQMLPCGYNIRYTWQANYAVLRNIYHARKNHRLPEWRYFCEWIETLPYSELITGSFINKQEEKT